MDKADLQKVARSMAKATSLNAITRDKLCEKAGIHPRTFERTAGCSFATFIIELRREGIKEGLAGRVMRERASDREQRREEILGVASTIMEKVGKIAMSDITDTLDISRQTVYVYFKNLEGLTRAVMQRAVETDNVKIIAHGLLQQNKIAMKAKDAVKEQARQFAMDLMQ